MPMTRHVLPERLSGRHVESRDMGAPPNALLREVADAGPSLRPLLPYPRKRAVSLGAGLIA